MLAATTTLQEAKQEILKCRSRHEEIGVEVYTQIALLMGKEKDGAAIYAYSDCLKIVKDHFPKINEDEI